MDDSQTYSGFIYVARDYVESLYRSLGRNEDGVVVDIGCGPGERTTQLILPLFQRTRKLVAVDVSNEMIQFAKRNYSQPVVEYRVGDIEDWSTVQDYENQVSLVTSTFCFYWMRDPERAYRNVLRLLKPGGRAAILDCVQLPFWDTVVEVADYPRWRAVLRGVKRRIPESHFKGHKSQYFRDLLLKVGFEVIKCTDQLVVHEFPNDTAFKEFFASITPLTSHIPADDREEFKKDLFESHIKRVGRSINEKPLYKAHNMKIVIKKPHHPSS